MHYICFKIMKYINGYIVIFAVAMCSCGSNSGDGSSITELDGGSSVTDPVDYRAQNMSTAQVDSIAINRLDFLTPGEGVGILYYYYQEIEQTRSASRKEPLKRKFKDVYDILSGAHGSEFKAAMEKLTRVKGVNLATVYDMYAGLLDTADDGGATASEAVTTDTAVIDTAAIPQGVTDVEVTESNGIIIVNPSADDTPQP